jgi:hypothetical protein
MKNADVLGFCVAHKDAKFASGHIQCKLARLLQRVGNTGGCAGHVEKLDADGHCIQKGMQDTDSS